MKTIWPLVLITPSSLHGSPATSWRSRCSSQHPEAVDFARESADTLSLYGIDRPRRPTSAANA